MFRIVFVLFSYTFNTDANAEDGSCITNPDVLKTAADLWNVDSDEISNWLTHRKMGGRDVIIVSYTVEQAQHARDAMVKRVYAELFQYIVNRINDTLSAGGKNRKNFIVSITRTTKMIFIFYFWEFLN